jgi:conjugative relaxase-like TrwC/TraI family protein
MMAREQVEYHRVDYYRSETPMVWGGAGAARLGLRGAVTSEAYNRIYGEGGARDEAGNRLARTRRPGMEVVVSLHKSVAELGVIGRADDMHRILDAERDATLAYLEAVTKTEGGRRGRGSVRTPTTGLIYASTRHGTSRAGDPCPHDHVLLANVVEMRDNRGGWKAADTALWRHKLMDATRHGQEASAREAERLGYGVDRPEDGSLRHWAIRGVPDKVLKVHSKRAAQIAAEAPEDGDWSYQSRSVAARATRAQKGDETPEQLMPRWRDELESVGWPVDRLAAAIDTAARKERERERLEDLRHRHENGDQVQRGRAPAHKEGQDAPAVHPAASRYRSRVPAR